MRRYGYYCIISVLLLCFLSCAAPTIYLTWEDQLDKDLSFSQIIQHPERYRGKMVYLGGTIISTLNAEMGTEIEVLQKLLDSVKKPKQTDQSGGRFLIMYSGYLDPAIYAPQRDIVVVGKIAGTKSKPLGEIEYQYPIIAAKEVLLMEQKTPKTGSSFGIGVGIGGVGIGL